MFFNVLTSSTCYVPDHRRRIQLNVDTNCSSAALNTSLFRSQTADRQINVVRTSNN